MIAPTNTSETAVAASGVMAILLLTAVGLAHITSIVDPVTDTDIDP